MQSKVLTDIKKNRLLLTYKGIVSKKEADAVYTEIRFAAADLKPGFDVISDFSQCKLAHVAGILSLRKMMNFLLEKGVREVVRIVGEDNIINKQMLNFATRIPGYKPIFAYSFEEAEEKLNSAIRRQGMRIHFHNLSVEYLIDGKAVKGQIKNISISGCAVASEGEIPKNGESVSLLFILKKDGADSTEIQVEGDVVRVGEDNFAVHFRMQDDDAKNRLFSFILHESRQD